ncbi:MAG: hypothetical protein FIA95_15090 [Gemmatimonadetes bacterium]|nr:hypothetical protein [Gemmatimonadota bacterium]
MVHALPVAASLLLLCQAPSAAQNRLVAEVPIELAHSKTVLPVTVGGTTLRLILDTGMPYDGVLVFDTAKVDLSRFANLSQAQIGGAGQGGASGALHDPTAGFSIGSVGFGAHPVTLLTSGIYRGFPNDGVIGYSLLGHYAVEVDYGAGRLRLYDAETFAPEAGWASVDLRFKGNRGPWMDFAVASAGGPPETLAAYIDFASSEAVELLEREVNAFTMPPTGERTLIGRGLSGDIYGKPARLSRVRVGPFTLEDVRVMVTPAAARSQQSGADAGFGNGLLGRCDLVFDYAHGKRHLRDRGAAHR